VINFSHGITFTFGAYFFWAMYQTIGYIPAMILSPVLVAGIGFLVERLIIRRVYGQDPLFGLLITLGFAIAMEELIRMIFGPAAQNVSAPSFANGVIIIGDFLYSQYRLFIAAVALAMIVATWLVTERSSFGAVVKAGMFNSEMVGALGHDLYKLRLLVMVLGSFAAGLAGILAAPIWSVKSGMGSAILMPSFLIVLIGGLGSIPGTLIGGLLVGLSISLGSLVAPRYVDIIE
jgi:branched-chain amino acid transport system permease protein